jgi:hypothetical protein
MEGRNDQTVEKETGVSGTGRWTGVLAPTVDPARAKAAARLEACSSLTFSCTRPTHYRPQRRDRKS